MIEPRYLRFQLLSFRILHLYYLFRAIMHTSGTCNFFPIFWYLFPQLTIKKFKSLFISLLFLQNSTMMMLMFKSVLSLALSFILECHSFLSVFLSQEPVVHLFLDFSFAQISSGIEKQKLTTLHLKYFIKKWSLVLP